ncbi:MAG: DUF1565 domain-containing protein, partial [Deltaproteobacteria bacterium]|nr:DUF1565 domain-containing protein [Deltaproteobacteria bacterium]
MKRFLTMMIVAVALGLALGACGRTRTQGSPQGPCVYDEDCPSGQQCIDSVCVVLQDGGQVDAVVLKDFGEPCASNEECRSTYCLANPQGSFCTKLCEDGCPTGWECSRVPDPHGGSGTADLCAVVENHVCQSCIKDQDCGAAGSHLCLPMQEGQFCGKDCTYASCPDGYVCKDVSRPDGHPARQCEPTAGTCVCSAVTDGMVRGCQRGNEIGTCHGYEVCSAQTGWGICSAREPAAEDCNGLDDDCDGFVDEDLPVDEACQSSNDYGTCDGTMICQSSSGWFCDAQEPAAEVCDGQDNDCDGLTDEGFVDGQGRYVTEENCGSCGVNCADQIPHASATECRLVDGQATCRASACEQGYFSYLDGAICLALPDNLCTPCASDEDCLAPGSKCVDLNGEQYCGRDCSPQSVYGSNCPQGYRCEPYHAVFQCLPSNGTCQCRADTAGAVRSCHRSTCQGYQSCEASGGSYEWTTCNVEDYNVEICDGLDNDCNGQIDEGFLNPNTGRYESVENCGFCNNDCTKYWTPELDHVTGRCDTSLPTPQCRMGACLTESEGGVTYEYVDVDGDSNNGCECRRVQGNTNQDEPDLVDEPVAGQQYIDENCDGVDGVAADALFVWAGYRGANGPSDGTRLRPYQSITQAVSLFASSGKRYILVAEGTYEENVVLRVGVKLHGGYSADFLHRDIAFYPTVIEGQPSSGGTRAAVQAEGINGSATTLVSGFLIQGRDVSQTVGAGSDGQATHAVFLKNCGDAVVIRSNWIIGGRGGEAGRGPAGGVGFGRQDSTQLDGRSGTNAARYSGQCVNLNVAGGAGGNNPRCSQANANLGGGVVCPSFIWSSNPYTTPHQGAEQAYHSSAGGNGLGGYDWSFDDMSGQGCAHATESGWPTAIQTRNGRNGIPGQDGANGLGGVGCHAAYGSVQGGLWVASPSRPTVGSSGQSGHPGGGGGAGGGIAYYHNGFNSCPEFESGP